MKLSILYNIYCVKNDEDNQFCFLKDIKQAKKRERRNNGIM